MNCPHCKKEIDIGSIFQLTDYLTPLNFSEIPKKGTLNPLVPEDYTPHPVHCIGHGQLMAMCCEKCLCLNIEEKYWNCRANLACQFCHRKREWDEFNKNK